VVLYFNYSSRKSIPLDPNKNEKEMTMRSIKSGWFKTLGIILAFFPVFAVSITVSAADSYPSKPVRLIATIAPGGGVDIIARLLAAKLTERLGKQVIVENIGGAGGIIAMEKVAKAAPDGYMLVINGGKHTIQPALEKLPYDPVKSFTPIAQILSGSYAFVVQPGVPAHSVKELIALAKQKPGQLIFVTSGSGSTSHMSAELLKMMADIDFKIVHFKGGGPGITDMLGGHSHASINSTAGFLPHIKSGKLRVLATGGVKRSVILPDVPTIEEAGVPGFVASSWYGIFAPAGMPVPIVDRLNQELKAILNSDDGKKQFLDIGVEVDYLGPAEFVTHLQKEVTRWASVAEKANIKLEN
jgi:tripartite-type tricarboxylate transporter receptor subunit TctC